MNETTANNLAPYISSLREAVQAIANELDEYIESNQECLNVPFPTGIIRSISELTTRWPYLNRSSARTVACTIQLCDVNRFFMNTWKISLTAGAMWEWHCAIPVLAVIETLLYEYGTQNGIVRPGSGFKKVINTFNSSGILSRKIRDRLHELRGYRNEVHLHLKDEVKMYRGTPEIYNQAVTALKHVEQSLIAAEQENKQSSKFGSSILAPQPLR